MYIWLPGAEALLRPVSGSHGEGVGASGDGGPQYSWPLLVIAAVVGGNTYRNDQVRKSSTHNNQDQGFQPFSYPFFDTKPHLS